MTIPGEGSGAVLAHTMRRRRPEAGVHLPVIHSNGISENPCCSNLPAGQALRMSDARSVACRLNRSRLDSPAKFGWPASLG